MNIFKQVENINFAIYSSKSIDLNVIALNYDWIIKIPYFEIFAKGNTNVETAFEEVDKLDFTSKSTS